MLRRREFCLGLALLLGPALAGPASAQDVKTVTLVSQHGLPYLPLMVMEEKRLVETHAERLGIPDLTAQYRTLGGTSSLVDALLSGQMNFGVTGVPGLITLWDKTVGTPNEVRALSAVQSMPYKLVTNRPEVRSIADFTEQDRIAVPSVKVSSQAIVLQMAAAEEWGQDQYERLDPLTITRPHPDAAAALMSGSSEITAHFAAAPFYQYELATEGLHEVLSSYDVLGGTTTNGVMIMSKRFGEENPKVTEAVYAALSEAEDFIKSNPREAAEIYIEKTNEQRSSVEQMVEMISDPENVWTTTPENTMKYLDFMHTVGTISNKPESWKDLFMPVSHDLPGS